MADIFEIKSVDIKVRFKGVDYPFADPNILQKIGIQKKMKELNDAKDTMTMEYWVTEMSNCTKSMIKLFVPSMGDDLINSMGDCESQALMTGINELALKNFGAIVEKVTEKVAGK